MSAAWKPDSWRAKPVQQMAEYPKEEAAKVFDKLGKLPPLVQPAARFSSIMLSER